MSLLKNRAVFLDRDGVLIETHVIQGKPYAVSTLRDLKIIHGVKEALSDLKTAGFLLIVVTNQPDLAKGTLKQADLDSMHHHLREELGLDDFYVCPHRDEDRCRCRKPKPGMIQEAAKKWKIDISRSYLVGDRWRDIDAAKAAGCKSLWVEAAYNETKPVAPDWQVKSLWEAAVAIQEDCREALR